MTVSVRLPPKRRLCGTAEAADLTGYSQRHIVTMANRGEIWSEKLSARVLIVDLDELERLARDKASQRKAGKLCGRPRGYKKTG